MIKSEKGFRASGLGLCGFDASVLGYLSGGVYVLLAFRYGLSNAAGPWHDVNEIINPRDPFKEPPL